MKDMIGILRSAVAVLAGLAAVVVLSAGMDFILTKFGVLSFDGPDPTASLAIATFYRAVSAILGAYITAKFAPEQPMLHAIILGMIGSAVALYGCITMWHVGNHWYAIALVIIALPCSWIGGRLAR